MSHTGRTYVYETNITEFTIGLQYRRSQNFFFPPPIISMTQLASFPLGLDAPATPNPPTFRRSVLQAVPGLTVFVVFSQLEYTVLSSIDALLRGRQAALDHFHIFCRVIWNSLSPDSMADYYSYTNYRTAHHRVREESAAGAGNTGIQLAMSAARPLIRPD